jgi:DNA-directed RNA polymerase specialized sigma subunit
MTLIDKVYKERYKDIFIYTQKAINFYKRRYDAHAIISESYIYAYNKNYKIDITEDELEGDIKSFIKNTIKWSRSFINNNKKLNDINKSECIDSINLYYDDFILDETIINNLIEEYLKTLNRIEKRLFEIYYYKDINTKEKIRNYLGISNISAQMTNKECRRIYNRFREYIIKKNI